MTYSTIDNSVWLSFHFVEWFECLA